MRVCVFIDNFSFISKILLDAVCESPNVEEIYIYALSRECKKNKFIDRIRNRFFSFPNHPKYYEDISRTRRVRWIVSINADSIHREISDLNANVILSLGFPEIMHHSTIERLGLIINYHNSFLPEGRGVFATHRSMLDHKETCGYSFHRIEEEIDGGAIYYQEKIKLDYALSAFENELNKTRLAASRMGELLNRIYKGIQPFCQNVVEPLITSPKYYSMLEKMVKEDATNINKIVRICGACEIEDIDGRRLVVTKITPSGRITHIKGLPVWLYRLIAPWV